MTQPRVVGMLVNHQEIDHLLTQMSDVLRNRAYNLAKQQYPKGHPSHLEFFDEEGTLVGYDIDTNKALLRDALDHYVQYSRDALPTERLDFANYLQESFQFVAQDILNDQHALSFLTASFASACGILVSVLNPIMEDITAHGQLVDKIESFATSFENTFYLVYGEDVDNPEQYDPTEDDLSTVDCSQTPEELAALELRDPANKIYATGSFDRISHNNGHTGINLAWNPES